MASATARPSMHCITVTASPVAAHASMMDFVDLARRAASTSSPASIAELEATVRSALADIVRNGEPEPATVAIGG